MSVSKFAVGSGSLAKLLKVALLTAPSKSNEDLEHVNGVYLYTQEGLYTDPNGEEDEGPQPAVMLCSLTTDSLTIAGHSYIPVDGGELKKGIFIPAGICKIVSGYLAGVKGPDEDTEAVTAIEVDHVTGEVSLADYYAKDDGVRLNFKISAYDSFPVKVVSTWIGGITSPMRGDDGNPVPPGPVMSFSRGSRSAITKVENFFKEDASFYVGHRGSITQVSIGDSWRGAIKPSDSTKSLDESALLADLNLPGQDEEGEN